MVKLMSKMNTNGARHHDRLAIRPEDIHAAVRDEIRRFVGGAHPHHAGRGDRELVVPLSRAGLARRGRTGGQRREPLRT